MLHVTNVSCSCFTESSIKCLSISVCELFLPDTRPSKVRWQVRAKTAASPVILYSGQHFILCKSPGQYKLDSFWMQIPVARQRRVQWVTFCIWISEMNGWILMSEAWWPRTITQLTPPTHYLSVTIKGKVIYLDYFFSSFHCLGKSFLHLFHSIVSSVTEN